MTAGSEPVAALRQVTKAFGTRSLFAGYDAEFRRGAMTAVIGRSGSGKSTMLAMLAGLERPDAGEVLVLGEPLSQLDRDGLASLRRSSVAYVGQEPGLVGFLSAEENVTFTLGLRGVTGAAAVDRARESLSQVGLGPRSDQRAARLSAGERQRLAIARALATGADLLLVDEPTSRLDQANAESVAALLADAAAGRSMAVVCATHDPLLIECAGVEMRLDDEPSPAEASVPGAGAVGD